ncbi:hypothetical protein TeGR_g13517, partial [Tetraparma gracilis]
MRAIEISKSRAADPQNPPKTHKGHGAHNASRSRVFAAFLLERFLSPAPPGPVLDVAGGSGEVAVRLSFCHRVECVLLEPREADLRRTFEKRVLPFLPKKHQARLRARAPGEYEALLAAHLPSQRVARFLPGEPLLAGCSLLLGLHADEVTEPIVRAALAHGKACAVVPCCVFPSLFKERRLPDGRQVRTVEQLVAYLVGLHPSLKARPLPFPGRNVAVYRYPRRLRRAQLPLFLGDYARPALLLGHGRGNQYADAAAALAAVLPLLEGADLLVYGGDAPDPSQPCLGLLMREVSAALPLLPVLAVAREARAGELDALGWVTHVLPYEGAELGGVKGGAAVGATGVYLDPELLPPGGARVVCAGGGRIAREEVAYARAKGYEVRYVRAAARNGGGYGDVDALFAGLDID